MNASKKLDEVWKLINETALLLSRTAVKDKFQGRMAAIHACLQSNPLNPAIQREVSDALTELRRQLRLAGYNLAMGKYSLVFDGFHDDDVLHRMKRAALFIDRDGKFYWETGDGNHIILGDYLEQRLRKRDCLIAERHYLWFFWTKTALTLSGSATELEESYLELKARYKADPLLFLSRIQGLY